MRILFCSDTYPPQVNGVSVVTALSVRGLAARGWTVGVVAPRYPVGTTDPFRDDGAAPDVEVRIASLPLPVYPETRLCAPDFPAVWTAARRFRPDIVHSATEFTLGRIGQLVGRWLEVPLTSSYHTDFAKYVTEYGVPSLAETVSRYIARFHRRSRRTYTPSGPAREYLSSIGVPNVEVWGRGVNLESFAPRRRSASLRCALGLEGRFTFLHAGRLAAEKGVDRVVDAFRLTRAALGERVRLVIAGAGPEEAAIRQAAGEGVHFLGYLDRERALPELYASCDAFVFASLTETLGLVVLEAMASGLPVIAAPAGGVADHLRHGVNGLAYPGGDVEELAKAMIRLAQQPQLAHRLAEGARATAERLDWERELDRLDASYREVVEQARADSRQKPLEAAALAG